MRSIYPADVDGDGDMDILGAAEAVGDITWWENSAGDGSAWNEGTIEGDFGGALSVYAADLDGDGDTDVLGAASTDHDITWWENTAGDGSAWNESTIEGDFAGAGGVHAADLDGDGDMDVLGSAFSGNAITWWENTAGDGSSWSEETIRSNFSGALSVHAADVDGDGDLDVLGAARNADTITWWENTAGDGSGWSEDTIDDNFGAVFSVHAADVDGDGDMDVLGAAQNDGAVAWWRTPPVMACHG